MCATYQVLINPAWRNGGMAFHVCVSTYHFTDGFVTGSLHREPSSLPVRHQRGGAAILFFNFLNEVFNVALQFIGSSGPFP